MTPQSLLVLLLMWALAWPVAAQDDARRAAFQAALTQAEAGVTPTTPDTAALREYRLYPYLQAARLQSAVQRQPGDATDVAVLRFLDEYPNLPVSRDLRRQWLNSLAQRAQWPAFLAQYRADSADPGLNCHRYQARIETGDLAGLQDELTAFWVEAPQMSQACVAPFRWLQAQGQLTPARTEQRARKALSDGNVELSDWLIKQLPETQRAPLAQWQRLLRDPPRELGVIAGDASIRFEWQALLAGFSRYARRDSSGAQALLQRFDRRRFEPGQYEELQRWAALGLSWDRKPEALAAFRAIPETAQDARTHEWRIRSALWNRQLEQASQWLHQLPADMAAEPRWIYWRARVLEVLGRGRQSPPIYRTLTEDNGYYGLLSAWRLGEPYRARSRPLARDAELQAQLLQRPALLRARELNAIGRANWANAEWRDATADLDAAGRVQAAQLASAWGWHVQAVSMLAQANAGDALEWTHPDAYAAEIRRAAQHTNLQTAWIYGVMRQESLFHPQAVSSANAYGLLQLLLPTAQGVARRWQMPAPTRESLFRPEVNVPLGAAYLREMTDRFDGQFLLTLAAYNAGPNAVPRWLPEQPMDADFWIENVPFNETRGYLQRILWHMAARATLDGKPLDVTPLLQPVHRPPAR